MQTSRKTTDTNKKPALLLITLASVSWVIFSLAFLFNPRDLCVQDHDVLATLPVITPNVKKRKNYDFTAAICVVAKDAEANLEEWIDYHLEGMDFQNIYLYDNSDNFDLQGWYNNTRDDPVYSKVQVFHYPGNSYQEEEDEYIQLLIYADCVQRFGVDPNGPKHEYMALIDIDEFLVLQEYPHGEFLGIRDVLARYLVPYGGALTVNWMLFGTANHTVYAPIPLTKRFQYRDQTAHNVIKSIVKSSDFVNARNPHSARLKNGAKTHTTKCPGCELNNPSKTKASDQERPSDVILLYHYRYTSSKEYLDKRCNRGNLSVKYIWCSKGKLREDTPDHIQPHPGTVYDDKAWKFLTSRVSRYKAFENWKDYA